MEAFNFDKQIRDTLLCVGDTLEVFKMLLYKIPNTQREAFIIDFKYRIRDGQWREYIDNTCHVKDEHGPHDDFLYAKQDIASLYDYKGNPYNDFSVNQIEAIGHENWLIRKQKELNEVENYIESFSNEFALTPDVKITPFRFNKDIDPGRQMNFVLELFKELKKHEFISCNKNEFLALFHLTKDKNKLETRPIFWKGEEKALAYLIQRFKPTLAKNSNFWVTASQCFYGKGKKQFKNKQLNVTGKLAIDNPKGSQLIISKLLSGVNSKVNNFIP